jgi:hypothetical protein
MYRNQEQLDVNHRMVKKHVMTYSPFILARMIARDMSMHADGGVNVHALR